MPATWMGSRAMNLQTGWTDHTDGAPGLNGGAAITLNKINSSSTASFKGFSVVN